MKSGKYRVHVGELPYELIEVLVHGTAVSIIGPIWTSGGTLENGRYYGRFYDVNAAGTGEHVGFEVGSGMQVDARFTGGPTMTLTWRPEP